jgi:cytoskeletal protein RodZ
MKHHEVGSWLHHARVRRGMTLQDIARSTKIPVRLLGAIEVNDFARLPGGVFRRAYVRAFAAEVGLDPDELSKAYVDAHESEPDVDTAPTPAVAFADRFFTRRSIGVAAVAGAAILTAAVVFARSEQRRYHPPATPRTRDALTSTQRRVSERQERDTRRVAAERARAQGDGREAVAEE